MNKSKFEKYNTPFQRLLRNMFADSIKDEWKTNEERDLFDKFFFLLGAAEPLLTRAVFLYPCAINCTLF